MKCSWEVSRLRDRELNIEYFVQAVLQNSKRSNLSIFTFDRAKSPISHEITERWMGECRNREGADFSIRTHGKRESVCVSCVGVLLCNFSLSLMFFLLVRPPTAFTTRGIIARMHFRVSYGCVKLRYSTLSDKLHAV